MFKKDDGAKPGFEYMAEFDKELGGANGCLRYGAIKYTLNNWKLGTDPEDIKRNKNAAIRHIFASLRGEEVCPESGNRHLHHALACLLIAGWHERKNAEAKADTAVTVERKPCPRFLRIEDTFDLDWKLRNFIKENTKED